MNRHRARPRALLAAAAVAGTALGGILVAAPAGAATTITLSGGILTVQGDEARNSFVVGRTAPGVITLNGSPVLGGTATLSTVQRIRLDGAGADDTLRIDETNGAMPAGELLGGDGTDTLVGGSAADVLTGGTGFDTFVGNGGADTLDGGPGNDKAIGGPGADTVRLGADSDQFTWSSGDGSDTLDGDAGKDTLVFNGGVTDDELQLISAGARVRFFVPLVPAGTVDMSVGGFELAKISSLAVSVTVNALPGSGLDVVHVAYPRGVGAMTIRGTNGPDAIRLAGTPTTGVTAFNMTPTVLVDPLPGPYNLTVIGAGGDDTIDAGGLAAGVTRLTEFGDLNGLNPGDDVLIGTPGDDNLFGGPGNDTVDGRGGNDTIIQDGP